MDTYLIAVRRDARERVATDWTKALEGIEGLTIVGAANPTRIQVLASPEAIEQARQRVGGFSHIEPVIKHAPS